MMSENILLEMLRESGKNTNPEIEPESGCFCSIYFLAKQ